MTSPLEKEFKYYLEKQEELVTKYNGKVTDAKTAVEKMPDKTRLRKLGGGI